MAEREPGTPPLHRDRQVIAAVVGALVGAIATVIATNAFLSSRDSRSEPPATQSPSSALSTTPGSPPSNSTSPTPTSARVLLAYEERQAGSSGDVVIGDARANGRIRPDSVQIAEECISYSGEVDDVEYDLGRGYSKFTAYLGMRDDSLKDVPARMSVYGDGRRLTGVDVKLGVGKAVTVNVTDVLRLTLRVEWEHNDRACTIQHEPIVTAVWGTPTVS